MTLETVELWVGRVAAVAAFATLGVALWGFRQAQSRPAGRETGAAHSLLRWPFLVIATLLYLGLGAFLWRPIPLNLSPAARVVALVVGILLFFPALGLYLWAYAKLGEMFGASSGFGVRLHAGHRLITDGPYAVVRHPMYLGVIVAFLGGLLLYRTWTMLIFGFSMLGLGIRARREEQALAAEFGEEWEVYRQAVPAWVPRLRGK